MGRKFTKEHKRKISESLKRYHKTCKKSKSSDNTEKQVKSFLAGIKSKSKSKSSDKTDKQIKSFLAGIKTKTKSADMNKKQLQKEIEKLKEMIKSK